jgi:hypothetical protein
MHYELESSTLSQLPSLSQVSDVDLESERFRYLGDLRLDVAAVSSIISRRTYRCTIKVAGA